MADKILPRKAIEKRIISHLFGVYSLFDAQ
jgi:hypothetical protein